MNKELKDKLSLQFIILTIVEKRFSELNYIYNEYHNDNKGTFNNFILDLMHIYRTCIIIDLCKLYIVPKENQSDKFKGKSHNVNFYYTIDKHKENLNGVYYEVLTLLNSLKEEISLITIERDKELAHKDVSTGINVKMHLNYIDKIEILIIKAREILEILFKTIDSGIDTEKYENFTLKKIITFLEDEKEKQERDILLWIEERNKSHK
jgi:hypothetical protein